MDTTERLYYSDSYLPQFTARVVAVEAAKVYLDRTAFYPTSGGQPFDVGVLGDARVVDVVDEGERIAHVMEGEAAQLPGVWDEVQCSIDWARRWDHMQQHSGQHLLSAALEGLYGIRTVSFHLGVEASTIDVDVAAVSAEQLVALERRANELIQEYRALGVGYEEAGAVEGLRKASEREGTLRIITIDGLDRSACGGTHVRATGEIGALVLRKTEKIRGTTRLEFLCGMRAVARTRMDYDALAGAARAFSAPVDQVPGLVAAQVARLADAEKARQRLELQVAAEAGRGLYRELVSGKNGPGGPLRDGPQGVNFAVEEVAVMDDAVRARANGFVEGARAVYLATCAAGPSYLFAVSADAGFGAAEIVKPILAGLGGKGGGTAALAQGRLASAQGLRELEAAVRELTEKQ
jgi:alanyl-tRNA synthetase